MEYRFICREEWRAFLSNEADLYYNSRECGCGLGLKGNSRNKEGYVYYGI